MSIDALLNTIRAHSQMAQGEKTGNRVGTITAYDPNKYAVKVKMWPDTQESLGWIPLASPWIGNGWGLVAGPSINDQVKIAFDREDQDAGVVVGRMFTDVDQPPPAPSGEFWLVHKSGGYLKLTNDGKVSLNGQAEADITAPTVNIQATGNVNVQAAQANVTATSSASVTAPSITLKNAGSALKALLNSAFSTWAQNHVHSNGNGGANTGVPTTTPGANTQTSVVQAE